MADMRAFKLGEPEFDSITCAKCHLERKPESRLSQTKESLVASLSIHVEQRAPDDWIVRETGGRELGHYSSQQDAENVGRRLATRRKAVLLVNGRSEARSESVPRKWFAQWLKFAFLK
jgi:hypothetical protein